MAKALGLFLLPILISILLVSARAASVEDFYNGKTIQFIVGGSAGGGYDAYTRLIRATSRNTFRANRPLSFKICLERPC